MLASAQCMPAGRHLPWCLFPASKTCSYGLIPGSVVLDSRVAEAEIATMDNAYLAASVAMFACCCCSCQSLCATTAASQVSTCLATTSGQRECRCGQSTGTAAGCHHTTQLSLTQLPGCAACDVITMVACCQQHCAGSVGRGCHRGHAVSHKGSSYRCL